MGKVTGLKKRGTIWHIKKTVRFPDGDVRRLTGSTRTGDRRLAEQILMRRVAEVQQAAEQPARMLFEKAAERRTIEAAQDLRSAERVAYALDALMPYFRGVPLEQIHDDSAQMKRYKRERGAKVAAGTLNREVDELRRVLHLAARKWRDDRGRRYLSEAPILSHVRDDKRRKPAPLTAAQEAKLLAELPPHLADAALFAINTGLREREQIELRWSWVKNVPELKCWVVDLPAEITKTQRGRIVPLNATARAAVERQRDEHSEFVFSFRQQAPVMRFNNSAFRKGRRRAGLTCRWHDLRHTFATRARATGRPLTDVAALLGHRVPGLQMTDLYAAPHLKALLAVVQDVAKQTKPTQPRKGTQKGTLTFRPVAA